MDGVKAFTKTIVDGLALLVANKPTPSSTGGIPALILQDIKNLAAALTAYIHALIALLPVCPHSSLLSNRQLIIVQPDLASELAGTKNTFDAAVTNAITAYS